ncbi:Outer membrane receptor proteins, mostly Fe transport [Sphingopyxis sp. YR583]|uniref:TonB-dependent receptor n=1 Tax=Sphingopyxis sp. YR583 TaxID=1881047 RepID=UPI0008A7FAC9|nr:TonB-dependent receptor [Sphingopyxis sp. YR583]SEH13929.1 Outer membrane receptor proteins, mostly Fe transport [Sphingopyxis sp. YR583]
MSRYFSILMASAALLPVGALAQTTHGQTGDVQSGDVQPGDIVVTAQRYEQRLQDVPLSVSVVGAKELEARGVTDLKDLQYSVPGFSAYDFGAGRQTVQLRGIATTIGASTVGVYFDETPLALDTSADAFNVRLLDLERVEVLRGPQATLYGKGSMGGTIRYIPAAPNLGSVGGSFEGEYSTTRYGADNYKAVGVLNLPLATDVAGVRLVAGYERIGGYIDNAATGERNINSADIYSLRGTLLVRPWDRFSASLLAMYQKSKQANQDFGVGYRTTSTLGSPTNDRYTLLQGKASYDLDFAELSASTSYIDRSNVTQFDLSAFFVPALVGGLGLPPGFIDAVGLTGYTDFSIYNSEVRLASTGSGRFGWQIGATRETLKVHQFGSTFTQPGSLPFAIIASDDARRSKSHALYGEVNYAFTPQLKATAGLRYFNETKKREIVSTNFGLTTTDVGKDNYETVNPRFNLAYEISPDSMLFLNIAKGFRSGGFNQTSAGGGVIPVPPSYEPDKIWTYELGTKHQLFRNKLTLEGSVYRSLWSNVQSNNFAPGSQIIIVNNSGHVAGWGVDLSAIARPAPDLTLTGTYGWNNLEFDEATADKEVGDPVDGAVRNSWSASLDYRPALSDSVTGLFRIDYQHAGKGQFTFRNLAAGQVVERPRRDLVNLRVGAAFGPVEVALFANNLFNEKAPIIIGPFSTILENVEQRPRVIGVNAGARF